MATQQKFPHIDSLDESSTTCTTNANSNTSGSVRMKDNSRYVMLYAQWHYPFASETELQPVVDSCTTKGPEGSSWSRADVSEIKQSYLTTLININTRFML